MKRKNILYNFYGTRTATNVSSFTSYSMENVEKNVSNYRESIWKNAKIFRHRKRKRSFRNVCWIAFVGVKAGNLWNYRNEHEEEGVIDMLQWRYKKIKWKRVSFPSLGREEKKSVKVNEKKIIIPLNLVKCDFYFPNIILKF